MKHLSLFALATFVASTSTMSLNCREYYHPDGYNFDLRDDNTAVLTLCGGMASTQEILTIPDEITVEGENYHVTEIAPMAFVQNEFLIDLTLGKYIERIDSMAFFSCPTITYFTAGQNLREIEPNAFYISTSLKYINLNEGLTTIAPSAFYNCGTLTEITIPASVSNITANPFMGCFCLQTINVPTESEYLTVKDGVLLSKDGKILYSVPAGRELKTVRIPEGVEIMTDNSARALDNATEIILPSTLKEIHNNSLSHNLITELSIPASVEKIGAANLMMCTELKNLSVASANKHFKAENGLLLSADGKKIFGSIFQTGDLIIPDGVEEIENYSFVLMQDITSVKFPDTMKKIGTQSFAAMYNLMSVDLGNSIEELGRECFSGDAVLNNVEIPASVKIIGNQAFTECDALDAIYIPDGVTEIGPYAFFGCNKLKTARIPGTIKEWGELSFYLCPRLETVTIEEGVTYLGENAFAFCDDLKNVSLPSTLKSIGKEGFIMTSISDIEWPKNLESIGDNAFQYCKFENITLPNSVKSIGKDSFSWIETLKTFNAGSNIEFVGENAFNKNKAMTDLYISATTPPTTDNDIFYTYDFDGYNNVTLHVPEESLKTYQEHPIWSKFKNIKTDASGIESVVNTNTDRSIIKIYNINGIPQTELNEGLNIVVYSDGTCSKIIHHRQ